LFLKLYLSKLLVESTAKVTSIPLDAELPTFNDEIMEFFTKLNDKSAKPLPSAVNFELISVIKVDVVYSLSVTTTVLDVPLYTSYTPK